MNSKSLSYLVLSDIHLGHRHNKTEFIIHNLREFFKDYHTQIKKCRIIFIAGDIFDTLLTTHGDDYLNATEWLTELILYCKHNKIKLRINNTCQAILNKTSVICQSYKHALQT